MPQKGKRRLRDSSEKGNKDDEWHRERSPDGERLNRTGLVSLEEMLEVGDEKGLQNANWRRENKWGLIIGCLSKQE